MLLNGHYDSAACTRGSYAKKEHVTKDASLIVIQVIFTIKGEPFETAWDFIHLSRKLLLLLDED
jgi:hypothetical protein